MISVGKSANRSGGIERVMGTQLYVGDLELPGMLHAKLVTLDCGRAKIKSIDTSKAERLPGVQAILTASDFPSEMPRFGPSVPDRPFLAVNETKFHGEPVALVVASDIYQATAAASSIEVDYEVLPAVTTIEQALAPDAPLVQAPELRADSPHCSSNILSEYNFGWGNPDKVSAELVIENTYDFPMITHFAIEPFTFLAKPEHDGVTVYTATQNPFMMQSILSAALNLPMAKVRVVSPDPGGAFGGKQHPKHEPLLAYAAMKLGKPVRLELSLEESFQAVRRAAARIDIRSGFDSDGIILFQDIRVDYLIGAYADIASRVVGKAAYVAAGPYRCQDVRIKARAVLSHTTPSTAFRGFGVPQVNWALESQIDTAALKLGIDRVQIRSRNLARKGEHFIPHDLAADGKWEETLQKAADSVGWGTPLDRDCGRGIALGLKMSATTAASSSIVRLHMDGSATLSFGTSDMGQGARTVFTQMVTEVLGIPAERITIETADTRTVPFDLQTSASRSTVYMGNAIVDACNDIKEQLKQAASEMYNLDPSQIEVGPGTIRVPGKTLTYEDLLQTRFSRVRGEFLGFGVARSEAVQGHPMGGFASFYELVCIAAELRVDRQTGEIDFNKLIVAGDVGRAINPQHVNMQDQGAAIQGLGHSVMEHLIIDDNGRIMNLGALDYRIPTSRDIPKELRSYHIENKDGPGPFGAKGCSEGGILSVAPAVAGAVEEASGVRIKELPLSPERIWRAINENERKA